ncbi:MAG TPA: cupin domain-containing protein [Pseudomonadales bacterium]|nr:cupin domain-containing protein [Pseudomonadales bacterium]
MKSINVAEIKEAERKSPQGKYCLFQKDISIALGNKKRITPQDAGHPFDLAWVRVPAGCKNWPVHRHSAQWELYYILEGEGRYFDGENWSDIKVGGAILSMPGESHQMENPGTVDLVYLVMADMPVADTTFYPATGLTFVKPEWKLFSESSAGYYDGHE